MRFPRQTCKPSILLTHHITLYLPTFILGCFETRRLGFQIQYYSIVLDSCGSTEPPSLCAAVSLASSFFLRVFLPPDFARRRRGRPRPTQPTQAGSSDPVSAAVSLISRLHSLCIFCPTHQTGPLPNRAGESIGGKLICSPFPWDLWKMIHFASERKISAS